MEDRIIPKEELQKKLDISVEEVRKQLKHPRESSFFVSEKIKINDNYYVLKIVENYPGDDRETKEVHVDSQLADFLEVNQKNYIMEDLYEFCNSKFDAKEEHSQAFKALVTFAMLGEMFNKQNGL